MSKMEFKTAQCRILPGRTIEEGVGAKRGHMTIVWLTPTRARQLINAGAVELVNLVPIQPGPANRPIAGPSETKPLEPAEKKFLSAAPDGQSTDSAPSIESGTAQPLSASQAGLVLPDRIQPVLKKRGRPRKSG